MRSVSLRLVDLERKPLIPLGFEGENEYMTINFDCKTVFDKHPAAVPTLAVTPPQGDSYPAVVVRDGDIVSWTVCDSDLVYPGEGVLQLTFVDGTIIGKTYKARTKVLDSITPSGEAPTPIQNWLIQAAAALQALPQEVSNAVVALMGAMVGVGETLDPGENVTVSYDVENNALTIGVPRGADGHSPAITANKVGKVATFYVDGVAIATISDGTDGAGIDDNTVSTESTWSSKKIDDENSALKTEIANKADIIISSASGSVASFSDGVENLPLEDCVVQITPVQDTSGGDPSPTNICQISGWTGMNVSRTGKNLYPGTVSGGIDNDTGEDTTGNNAISDGYIAVSQGTTYAMSGLLLTEGAVRFFWYRKDKTFISSEVKTASSYALSVTAPSGAYYARTKASHTVYTTDTDIQFEKGSATAYEAYQGTTYPITWQTEAGTVYVGNLNLTTGVLTATHAIEDLGNLTWTYASTYDYFRTPLTQGKGRENDNIFCSLFKYAGICGLNADMGTAENATIWKRFDGGLSSNATHLYVKWTEYTDGTQFTNAVTGQKVVYELATPITYNLTPTEIRTLVGGMNNLFSDTGDVSVQYRADTKGYVDGFYKKPSTGIPSSDMASAVQTSLGKAESAYQKPFGGIPLTDLADNTESVSGTTPSITGVSGHRYICGECATLSITAPASGCIDVVFESGSTPTVLTVSSAKTGVTAIKWANGFDPTALEANTTYEINILDGEFGVVGEWT